MLHTAFQDGIGVITLSRGVTNAINSEMITALTNALDEKMTSDTDVKVILLTSANDKFFSIGFDLPYVLKLSKVDFQEFYQAFNKLSLLLYGLPKPTVTALTGHVIAGGCILALCCDYRIIGQDHTLMGLNEVKLGVPVPYPGDVILRDLVGNRYAREIMELGEFYGPDQLLQFGMVDEIVPQTQVRKRAFEKAQQLAALSPHALQQIKQNRIQPVVDSIRNQLEIKEKKFLKSWFSETTQVSLREALKKF